MYTPNRHTVGAGIQGEWSNKTDDRPVKKSDLFLGGIVLGALYLAMSIGAAAEF